MIKLLTFLAAVTLIALIPVKASAVTIDIPRLKMFVTTNKVVHLNDVDKKGLELFRKEMKDADPIPGDLVVLINSSGGYEMMGREMINAIKAQKAKGVKVICLVETRAASMAFNFLTNCSVRLAEADASLLFHRLALASWPKGKRLTSRNLLLAAKDLDESDADFRAANAKALGLSPQEYDLLSDMEIEWTGREMFIMQYLQALVE